MAIVDKTKGKVKSKQKPIKAGKKDAQLLIRLSAVERDAFISLCEELDTSAAREIRRFIRGFMQSHSDKDEVQNRREL